MEDKYNPATTAEQRNIIVVGRSRTGKSSIVRSLENPGHVADETLLIPLLHDARINRFTIIENETSTHYTLNVIDTPGLYERAGADQKKRDNERLQELISFCATNEITKIHKIYFTIAFSNGINSEDISSFELILEKFKELEKKIFLIITHAESKSTEKKESLEKEIRAQPDFKKLLERIGKEILFFGAINHEHQEFYYENEEILRNQKINIRQMRETLLKHIIREKESLAFHELPLNFFHTKKKKELEKLLGEIRAENNALVEQLYKEKKAEIEKLTIQKNAVIEKLTKEKNAEIEILIKENEFLKKDFERYWLEIERYKKTWSGWWAGVGNK